MTPKNNIIIGIIIALLVVASYNVDADPIKFVEGIPNLVIIVEEVFTVEPKYIPTALWAMFETIQITATPQNRNRNPRVRPQASGAEQFAHTPSSPRVLNN